MAEEEVRENLPPETSVERLKVVKKALELPIVLSAYTEISSFTSPLTRQINNTFLAIKPVVDVGYYSIKEKVDHSVMPHLPQGTTETCNGALTHLSMAVEKVDTFACKGMDHLVEKLPVLKKATPELVKSSKVTATDILTDVAGFSVAQLGLTMVDLSLQSGIQLLEIGGGSENVMSSSLQQLRLVANDLRVEGNKKAGTEKAQEY